MMSRWYERLDYNWILTADPPVCAGGQALAVLNACSRRRRDQPCVCRFKVKEMCEDLAAIGDPDISETWLNDTLEPDEVEEFRDAVVDSTERAKRLGVGPSADPSAFEHALDRIELWVRHLDMLVERGSGLSDEFVDALLD